MPFTCLSAVAPSPISVAPFTGATRLPSFTRYASVQEKTNLPLVMSTWPPPKPTAWMPSFMSATTSAGSESPASM